MANFHTHENKPPAIIYGTAWQGPEMKPLVCSVISAGINGFDTAEQQKNYSQGLLGDALRLHIGNGLVSRHDLWQVQTKFSPYDNGLSKGTRTYETLEDIATHVYHSVPLSVLELWGSSPSSQKGSFSASASASASEAYIDCLILHSVLETLTETLAAWSAMESFVPHPVRALGISNISFARLRTLYDAVVIKPHVVQNTFSPDNGFDSEVRTFCQEKGIFYQGFFIVKRNKSLLKSTAVQEVANTLCVDPEPALMSLVESMGVSIIFGSSNEEHIKENAEALAKVKAYRDDGGHEWWRRMTESLNQTMYNGAD
ncbi:NADP-dependent oxidoreductase domain-containing protein [Aspergillus novoparasiticus]|uniref:NADP-dependent oxidoreductase domain-containing protein n=1 Tax=Aspergillus novoparasiticus TaxID=986946 RepID=A0A5N6EQ46_9EURO|nr:NADP-dependent oxidoreductase domain-containing protein [Aspergillus novoparasiticus]